MYLRLSCALFLALAGSFLCGCLPGAEGQSDEQKNAYFIQGKERARAGDSQGAIESFEKSLRDNPKGPLTHFELGVLYEKNGNQKDDYVIAMYHYLQVLKIRPNDYPAENARQRIQACKQELIKTETLAPIAAGLLRDLDRLKVENQNLQKQLETTKVALTNALKAPVPAPGAATGGGVITNSAGGRSSGVRITPLPPVQTGRTYTIKDGDSFFSIARQFSVKMEALQAANPSITPKRMKVGQTINIPASSN